MFLFPNRRKSLGFLMSRPNPNSTIPNTFFFNLLISHNTEACLCIRCIGILTNFLLTGKAPGKGRSMSCSPLGAEMSTQGYWERMFLENSTESRGDLLSLFMTQFFLIKHSWRKRSSCFPQLNWFEAGDHTPWGYFSSLLFWRVCLHECVETRTAVDVLVLPYVLTWK